MNMSPEQVCSHCGISFRWKAIIDIAADGSNVVFCCRGCHGAYHLICAAGLDSFYLRSDRAVPTVGEADVSRYTEAELLKHLVPEGDVCRFDILIHGITCPSCVWLLERMMTRMTGVESVSISYSGGIASLRFDPAQVTPLELFSVITSLGYTPRPYSADQSEKDAKRERDDLLLRFGTALFLTMQLMAYSYALYAGYFQGIDGAMKQLLQYVSLLVTTPVVFYSGWPFLAGAWRSIKTAAPGMDLLIALGALSAWLYSVWALFTGQETYFESAAMIVTFILIGRLLEISVRRKAMSGISSLYAAAPQRATLVEEEGDRTIEVDAVRPGDLLLVRQGERFPVDCLIVEGATEVDQSLATGESQPVLLTTGDEVRSGCVNVAAPVTVQALRPAGQSYLMRVAALVQMAQAGKPILQKLADRVSGWFVLAVIFLALLVAAVRLLLLGDSTGTAFMAALSIILIACPCAMGLAVPAAVLAACSRSATLGIILRGGDVIERLASINSVLFDKTGTVTCGLPGVVQFDTYPGHAGTCVLQSAATVEELASHPLARAIVGYAAEQGYRPESCRDFCSIPGRGISGVLPDGRRVLCGSLDFLQEQGIVADLDQQHDGSASAVLVAIDGELAGRFLLVDQLRKGAGDVMSALVAVNMSIALISGDHQLTVERIAAETGIAVARGAMTPNQKLEYVTELHEQGRRVLMVGDGINDAPALAAATVSCSLSDSSDIALENADVIISENNLMRIATAYHISRATMTIIKQNLAWAFVYNIVGIPLAMAGILTPVYAAVAMTASSLLVSLNSLRLMRFNRHG
ncbi:MAG: heavy metal translocating P-type ATPase metal-binding domain-containing protein [Desulfuromonadaceae bacterium]|nr:heavy metal translocating P-type ATPase metal-binding domain-containing protein [Desulfuromonadaceae bacterium]MDD5105783.1 heavy metal translocating P-type ATPase metal-binding domain-containing protein [Desulfuromonadaceae bacterium]